jgi:hypothetical protein
MQKVMWLSFCISASFASAFAQRPIYQKASVYWLNNSAHSYEVQGQNDLKTYYLKTNADLRDNFPSNKEIRIDESLQHPRTRTQSPMFDALFALAVQEMQTSSVSRIFDHAFEDTACNCFETGEKWRYVWTRDTAYATELGLAALDPVRSMNSLLFKISRERNGDGREQIVQDTGTGGSWPVSTDRVIWAIGADETLKHLAYDSGTYKSFLDRTFNALKNTIMNDRGAIYDPADGLYTGEQSFLDWREQSYPAWTAPKVIHIGMSKALSTNVAHYMALVRLSEIADELGDVETHSKAQKWAEELKAAINANFWDGESYRSIKTTYLDQRAPKYYDLLGVSLTILSGVASPEQARLALNHYPQTMVGPPVIWPQRPDIPVYHNRAIWPFVTAYALKAAKKIQDPALISAFTRSQILGPALNLSHMENYEFTTLKAWYEDGQLSGPVVNSRRQLWSVAGHLSLVLDVVFGKEVRRDAVKFNPALTYALRKEFFPESNKLELKNFKFQNKLINLTVHVPKSSILPSGANDALYVVQKMTLNGQNLRTGDWIYTADLAEKNELQITLSNAVEFQKANFTQIKMPADVFKMTEMERPYFFAPKTPELAPIGLSDNSPLLTFNTHENHAIEFHIYKDGQLIAKTQNTHYLDRGHSLRETACYTVVANYEKSNNESFPSEPFCFWPTEAIQHYPVKSSHLRTIGAATTSTLYGRPHLKDWGYPDQKVILERLRPNRDGRFALQVDYSNVDNISSGVSCGVKKISIFDESTGSLVREGVLMFPHHGIERFWSDSNFFPVDLKQNTSYTVILEDFFNMSYFEHFTSYRYRGGKSGPNNRFNLAEVKLLYLGQ